VERNFCLLIFFTCSLLANENFWFSYKVVTQNKIIVYEEKNISPLMQDYKLSKFKSVCKINVTKKDHQSTIDFLNINFNNILICFYPMASQVINKTFVGLKALDERSVLTINPVKFTVDFKDEFANINILR